MTREIRAVDVNVELRDGEDDGNVRVSGYAAVFDEETLIGEPAWGFREVIRPGAFTDAIGRDDVVFLVNHDGLPLARTASGTLKLTEDKRGLKVDAELDQSDPDVARIVPKMRRGDLSKMSFAFWPVRQTWTEDEESDDPPLREIQEVNLVDVAIVTTPAYEGTEIGLRALEDYRSKHSISAPARRARLKFKLGAVA